jgi:hypothetical protein
MRGISAIEPGPLHGPSVLKATDRRLSPSFFRCSSGHEVHARARVSSMMSDPAFSRRTSARLNSSRPCCARRSGVKQLSGGRPAPSDLDTERWLAAHKQSAQHSAPQIVARELERAATRGAPHREIDVGQPGRTSSNSTPPLRRAQGALSASRMTPNLPATAGWGDWPRGQERVMHRRAGVASSG